MEVRKAGRVEKVLTVEGYSLISGIGPDYE